MTNMYQQLSEPFPQEMERTLNKGGTNLTYIPVSEVINRLNKVLGVDKWSFTIQRCDRDAADPEFVVAHVRIDYQVNEYLQITRDGFGGQKIKRNKANQIVDLGDEFKGAISDALKKAAQTLGVGLYLARSEDAIEIEQVIASSNPPAPNAPASKHEASWESFKSLSARLNKDQKATLGAAWRKQYGDMPKPTSAAGVTEDVMQFLNAEIARIMFDGTYVEPGE
jgi:recombination DNA repair RAD52 pathway protein